MGKSVLLLDETSQSTQQRQTNGGLNNRSNYYNSQQQQDDSAVINMDLMQKQHMQKSLIVNQEVLPIDNLNFLIIPALNPSIVI